MSGPNYPPERYPIAAPGGQLTVGDAFDWWRTVLSQYANSPILTQLIASIDAWLDQNANFNAFYDLIWNVDTAQGYGLDVWGRIVGVNRVLTITATDYFGFEESQITGDTNVKSFDDAKLSFDGFFGFEEAVPGSEPLSQGVFRPQSAPSYSTEADYQFFAPFYAGAALNQNYRLSDESYRTLIFAKAMANITDGSIPSINQILLNLFPGRGNCFVTEPRPDPYFGFAEAARTRPTYIRSWNYAQEDLSPHLGFAEAVPGDDAFGQEPLFGGTAFDDPGNQASALAGPLYGGEAILYMAMTYTFNFALTPVELAIVLQSGVLPKPVGVSAQVIVNSEPQYPPSGFGILDFSTPVNSGAQPAL